MLDLTTISKEPRTRTVHLSMRKDALSVAVRGISAAEALIVSKAFVKPVPPRKKDPNGGSLATIPDEQDPAYQAAMVEYHNMVRSAEVAIASEMAITGADGKPEKIGSDPVGWVRRAAVEVQRLFAPAEIENMAAAMLAVSGFETIKAFAHTLIVEIKDAKNDPGREIRDPFELPENWEKSEEWLMMRAAGRYGQDPFKWPLTLTSDERNKVIALEVLICRRENEAEAMIKILSNTFGDMSGK